jgi:hypothetical protein
MCAQRWHNQPGHAGLHASTTINPAAHSSWVQLARRARSCHGRLDDGKLTSAAAVFPQIHAAVHM